LATEGEKETELKLGKPPSSGRKMGGCGDQGGILIYGKNRNGRDVCVLQERRGESALGEILNIRQRKYQRRDERKKKSSRGKRDPASFVAWG